jgi:hypothetical protein
MARLGSDPLLVFPADPNNPAPNLTNDGALQGKRARVANRPFRAEGPPC